MDPSMETPSRRYGGAVAVLATIVCACAAPAAQASFGIASFTAQVKNADGSLTTQAGAHPFVGVTSFTMNTTGGKPDGGLKDVRVDIPAGLVPNPEATPKCSDAAFAASACPPATQVGTEQLTAFLLLAPTTVTVPLYNMVAGPNQVADIAFSIPVLAARTDIIGGVRDTSDYGEFFTISGIPQTPALISSTLTFWGVPADPAHDAERGRSCTPLCVGGGAAGAADRVPFLSLPTLCGPPLATKLTAYSYESPSAPVTAKDTPPTGIVGCDKVPFAPSVAVVPDTTQRDSPAGAAVSLRVAQSRDAAVLASSHVARAAVQLPEGMTINPSAANGLDGCSDAQAAIGTSRAVACPSASKLGTATIDTPVLPGPLKGSVFLGDPKPGDPYRLFLVADGFGVSVRLQGSVTPDPVSGRLTTTFAGLPQVPFSNVTLRFNGGPRAPLANPLACGTATTTATFAPHSGTPDAAPTSAFTVDGDGKGAACGAALFGPGLATKTTSTRAGAFTALGVTISRSDGQQELSRIAVSEPPGLLGIVASVPRCAEADAARGACPAASKVGSTTVTAGAGSAPFSLTGPAYLTGPYGGAPFGLVVVVRVIAGPFVLGTVVVRAGISIDSHDTHLTVASDPLPRILQGIPLRLRTVTVNIDHDQFLLNPTSCEQFAFGGLFTSGSGATGETGSPFKADHCADLGFAPRLTATSTSHGSPTAGAPLSISVSRDPGEANLRSVSVQPPDSIVVRLPFKTCARDVFTADPATCPANTLIGSAVVSTPLLDDPLRGPVYLVATPPSRLPNMEVLLRGNGVSVNLSGNVLLDGSGVTATFTALPDVPFSTFRLDLPAGPESALVGTNTSLCTRPVFLPTIMVGQNGARIEQQTRLSVPDCAVKILRRKITGHVARVTVEVPAAGKLVATGGVHLRRIARNMKAPGVVTLKIPLTKRGVLALKHRPKKSRKLTKKLTIQLDAAGASAAGIPASRSSAKTTLTFRVKQARKKKAKAKAPKR